ncbi:MAG: hypothetical protein SNJ80_13460, partial [Anaerolinea sp.]
PAASAFTTTEDDEAADAPPAKPAVTARPFASPFSKPAASAFTTTEDDEAADAPPAKPAVPARPFTSPFSKPAASAFTTTEDDEETISADDDLPDPLADDDATAKPAAPRNSLYARASAMSNPFGQVRPVPKTIKVESDTEAEKALDSLMSSPNDDLSYEAEDDYYSEDDDEYASSPDD